MTDRTTPESRHDWFRARVVAQLIGLLDDDAERAFREHAAECGTCAAVWRDFEAEPPQPLPDGAHVPARVLARWDRSRDRLSGVAREIVRRHLETCAECRADLEHVGYEAELPEPAEAELVTMSPAADERAHVAEQALASRSPAAGGDRARWVAIGAFAGAVAASLALMPFLRTRETTHGTEPQQPPPPPAIVAPSPTPEPPSAVTNMGRLPDPIVLRAPSRDASEAGAAPVVRDPGRLLVLRLPDLFLTPGARVRLTLTGPDADVLARGDEEATLLARRGLVVVRGGDSPWPAGVYRLEASPLAAGGAPGPVLARFAFRIVRAGP